MGRCSRPISVRPTKAAISISSPRTCRWRSRRFISVAKNLPAKIVSLDIKYRGWATFQVAQLRLPNGATIKREIEDHGNAACVLPYDPVRKVATVVRQVRAPVLHAGGSEMLIEAP